MQRWSGHCMSPSKLIICTHLDRMGDLSMVRKVCEVYSRRTKEAHLSAGNSAHVTLVHIASERDEPSEGVGAHTGKFDECWSKPIGVGDLSSEASAEILCETYLAMIQVHFVEVQEEIEQDSTNSQVAGEEDEANVMEDHEALGVATFVSCKLQLHIVWEHLAIDVWSLFLCCAQSAARVDCGISRGEGDAARRSVGIRIHAHRLP